jgi:glucose/arabinose dehydrogenase
MSVRRSLPGRRLLVAAVAGVPLVLCAAVPAAADRGSPTRNRPVGDPIPARVAPGPVRVALTPVTTDVIAPLKGITAPGRDGELFVVDQVGVLWSLDVSDPAAWPVQPRPVLDVSDLTVGPDTPTDERGFLGAAFSPTFATDRLIYTDTSEPFDPANPATFPLRPSTDPCLAGSPQTPDHIDVVREWKVADPAAAQLTVDRSEPGQGRVLFSAEHPQANHNAGDLGFGPDGLLYITDGDGGGADDQDCQTNFDGNPMFGHPEPGNGQAVDTPLGKVLRIDPHATATAPYGIPAGNPFANGGPPGALPEIFAYGLRNPFRFSFDADTGDLWIGNVGQNDVEEVELGATGANYGWRVKEGTFLFDPGGFQLKGARSDGFPFAQSPGAPPGLTDPVAQYDHDEGTAIIGGFVYRGASMPALAGHYVFGDTSRRLNNRHGRLFEFDADGRSPVTAANTITELRDGPLGAQLIGFGQDANHELYAMVFGSRQFGQTGVVLRLSQAAPATG